MISPRQLLTLAIPILLLPLSAVAQVSEWVITGPDIEVDPVNEIFSTTNGITIQYEGAVLTADRAILNRKTGDVVADGRVRIQRDDHLWAGEHIDYNFHTRQLESREFRAGQWPVFVGGAGVTGDLSNKVYTATNAYVTTDDIAQPAHRIRASYIKIIPGESIEARNAVLYAGKVPVFYFPYYSRKLDERANRFTATPGYSDQFGGYLLGAYTMYLSDQVDGALRLDYRTRRGFGAGPDVNLHLGRWGEVVLKYYYTHDWDTEADSPDLSIPEDRHRFYFGYNATPFTNLTIKSRVAYESDERLLHDFFESEYGRNPQASTFFEVNKLWSNFSLDVYAQPRVNEFLETVERLPDIRLKGFRQQLGSLPLYYESESSAGWYRRRFAETNEFIIPSYSSYRADTFHQVSVPLTLFGWLNFTPRVGGRFTYYDCVTDQDELSGNGISRGVFNTGAELSFKASRVWAGASSKAFAVDGIRHILEPAANLVYVPNPNEDPDDLPQFDYETSSFRLLPIDFPDYNNIDSIDQGTTLRVGLRNKLQTKRNGRIENLLWWDLYTDLRIYQHPGEETFDDLFSDMAFRPRSWMTLESVTRWDMDDGHLNLALHSLRIQPNSRWEWGLGHWYVRDDFFEGEEGRSLISSSFLLRVNENWAFRTEHYFEARDGRMQQQAYTVFRDLRSWTAGLTLRLRENFGGPDDFAIAFTFSLKGLPRYGLDKEPLRTSTLLGN